jgi:hypothetical protein
MTDLLARRRLNANLLDRQDEEARRLGRLERAAVASDEEGLRAAALVVPVLDATPAPAPAGHVKVYAQVVAGVKSVRAIDDAGDVITLGAW